VRLPAQCCEQNAALSSRRREHCAPRPQAHTRAKHKSSRTTTLAGAETYELRRRFVCIATQDDNLVVPRASPLLPDAEHHVLDGVGHLALTEDPRAWRLIAQAVDGARTTNMASR
jgi:pimeloyl-ACP methyl ester carboxylesterase